MFSIIIPTLDEETYLPRLLDSLAEQSFRNFEVIVVDGGSSDATIAAARVREHDLDLRMIELCGPGVSAQRNAGAGIARGEWLLFVDADSVLQPYALERCAEFVQGHDIEFFTTWCSADTTTRGDALLALLANALYEVTLRSRHPFSPGPFTAVERDVFERVGGYAEDRTYQEDFEFTVRVVRSGVRLHMLRETLYEWSTRRVHRQGALRTAFEWLYAGLYMLVLGRPLDRLPGYSMGGRAEPRTRPAEDSSAVCPSPRTPSA